MKLGKIYELFIQDGITADPRPRQFVLRSLAAARKGFRKLPLKSQKFFDKETFHNPYADTRVLYGDLDRDIKRIMVGIDMDVAELLLADRCADKIGEVDLILSHHPKGVALAGLAEVMTLQTDLLMQAGVAREAAEGLMGKRIDEVTRSLHSGNHSRVVEAARLMDLPLMCCHTPADNHVVSYLQKQIKARKPRTLQSILDLLMKEPEYRMAAKDKVGPKILVGAPQDKVKRIFIDMTGGTSGSKEIFPRLSQLGFDTILCMHLSETYLNRVKTEYMKVVNAGHMASDSLGMNLLLDKLRRRADVEIIPVSGLRRVER